jgi:excisionase family DNA binding protein
MEVDMTEVIDPVVTPLVPNETDSELAATASRALARANKDAIRVRLDDGDELTLPKSVTPLLIHLLTEMAQGNSVTLIPVHAELSTQEVANLLNISRPHLVRLLEDNVIPHHKVGTHRRVKFTDVEAYKERFETQRRAALDELAKQAQDLGMGY